MTPTDLELCELVAASYDATPTWERGAARLVATRFDRDITIIAVPGTTYDPRTWLADLSIMPWWSRHVGICHSGFLQCALGVAMQARDHLVGQRIVFGGHSAGGSIALILAGLFIAMGTPVDMVTTFGAPRPGSWKLRRLLKHVRRLRQYRNGNDPVTRVPWFPLVYVHPSTLLPIGEAQFFPIVAHQIARYQDALKAAAL